MTPHDVLNNLNNSYAVMFTDRDQVDYKSVVLALAALFVVSRVVKYFNAKRVSV